MLERIGMGRIDDYMNEMPPENFRRHFIQDIIQNILKFIVVSLVSSVSTSSSNINN